MSASTEKIVDMVKNKCSSKSLNEKVIRLKITSQAHHQNLRNLCRDHFIQTKSGICATFTNDCDGNLFSETRKEENFTFVQ